MEHKEIEKKYLLQGEIDFSGYVFDQIDQYYFDITENTDFLQSVFGNMDISNYGEMRIRKTQTNCFLTLKSVGNQIRDELETEISLQYLNKLIPKNIAKINKTRYFIFEDDNVCATIDRYKDKNILEIEAKTNDCDFKTYLKNVLDLIGGNVTAKDVTDLKQFKNFQLAKQGGCYENN